MIIRRGPRKTDHFTILPNAVGRDATLSFKARGVLWMLLTYSGEIHLTADSITARSDHEGRRAVLTALKELRDAGFLHMHRWQDEQGRWRTENVLYEEPHTPEEAAQDRQELSTATEVRLPHSGAATPGPYARRRRTEVEGLKEGAGAASTPPPPVDNTTAPPPCRRHPNGWHHDQPCRACQALRRHDQERPTPRAAPRPAHCGHCDPIDRTISATDSFGHLVLTACPTCSPRRTPARV